MRAASLGPIPPPLPPPICTSETLGCSAKMKLREICVIFGCGMCNENVGAQQMRRRRGRYRGVGWCSNHLPRRWWRARRAESCVSMQYAWLWAQMWLRVEVRGALELWKGELILSRGEGGMGAQDLPHRRSLGERGPANEANTARSSAQNPPARPRFLHPCLLRSCLLHTRNQQRGGSTRRRPPSAVLRRQRTRRHGDAAERRNQRGRMRRWGGADETKSNATVFRKKRKVGVRLIRGDGVRLIGGSGGRRGTLNQTGCAGGGWSGSDQTRRLAWVHSLYRMHPGVI